MLGAEYKYYLPVIGIIIGWLLTELSHYFRNRQNDKRELRTIAYKLFELKFRLEQMIPILKEAHSSDLNNPDNKTIINSMLESEKIDLSMIIEELKSSLNIISSLNPFIAFEINLALNQDLYFTELYPLKNSNDLKKYLDLQLKMCIAFSEYLSKNIKKLLWQIDKIYFLKYLIRGLKDKKANNPLNNLFNK